MITLDLRDDFAQAAAQYSLVLTSGEIEAAIARALNKAIGKARSSTIKAIGKIYKAQANAVGDASPLSNKSISKTLRAKRAKVGQLEATLTSTGGQLQAYGFLSKVNTPLSPGASVEIKDGDKVIKGAFVAKMKSGHMGIFTRYGVFGRGGNSKQERIRETHTLAIPQAMRNQLVEENILQAVEGFLPDLIELELYNGVMTKLGKTTLKRRP